MVYNMKGALWTTHQRLTNFHSYLPGDCDSKLSDPSPSPLLSMASSTLGSCSSDVCITSATIVAVTAPSTAAAATSGVPRDPLPDPGLLAPEVPLLISSVTIIILTAFHWFYSPRRKRCLHVTSIFASPRAGFFFFPPDPRELNFCHSVWLNFIFFRHFHGTRTPFTHKTNPTLFGKSSHSFKHLKQLTFFSSESPDENYHTSLWHRHAPFNHIKERKNWTCWKLVFLGVRWGTLSCLHPVNTTTTSTRQQASRCVISKKWWRYMATLTMCYHFPHRARVLIIISKRRFSNQSTAAATAAVSYITHKLSLGISELVGSWKRKSISILRCDVHWAVVGLLPELRTYSYLAIKQGSGKRGMS